jgi:energy-coupling factor transporter ATP-binding protein EcfA2
MRLSGGERQRISLARAFLKDAPILILDEPTSSVDVQTEAAIMEAMERLMQGRTTFMIAHRLSTLAACDARLEIEHGRLVLTSSPTRGEIEGAGAQAHGARHGTEVALQTLRPPAAGPLATFPPAVAKAVLAYRHAHPGVGARRAQVALQQDPALRGLPLPDWRTIHRAWVAAGLVTPRGLPLGAPTLDQLYQAQIAARDGEIAAKDAVIAARNGEIAAKGELIVELRRRVRRVEQQMERLEQKLAELRADAEVVDLRADAEVVETQAVMVTSRPGLRDGRGRPDAG